MGAAAGQHQHHQLALAGSSRRYCERPRRGRRPAEIRTALQGDKGVSLAYTSIRRALGQLEARKAVEQDGNGGWRIA